MAFVYTGEQVNLGFGRGWLNRAAANSIRRIDARIGHALQITEAGRTWAQQNAHYQHYLKYGSPIALSPNAPSLHQRGNAIDSDEAQRIHALMEEHGWRRTVYRWVNGKWTLVEPWHYEYFPEHDRHINKGVNDMGTIDPTDANKQVIKDAIFEFLDGAGARGSNGWKFVREAIWGQPVQAQDADGRPLYFKSQTDRTTTTTKTDFPVMFSASGYLASTNAQVAALRQNGIAITLTPEQVEKVGADIAEALAGVVSGATPDEVRGIVDAALGALVLGTLPKS